MPGSGPTLGEVLQIAMVFPEFNAESPDAKHAERTTELGIYEEGCGLESSERVFLAKARLLAD